MPLTDVAIRNAKSREKPYKVGGTLGPFLLVQFSGGKLWRIMGINAAGLIGLVTLSAIGAEDAALWPEIGRRIPAGLVGGMVAHCAARMAYVVWRDIGIVRLQKRLIDGAAEIKHWRGNSPISTAYLLSCLRREADCKRGPVT